MIRKVHLEDNEKLLELFLKLDEETFFMMYEKGERKTTPDQMKEMIQDILTSGSIMFVDDVDPHLNGFISVRRGIPNRIKHTGYVVIGILEEASGLGLGTKLFEEVFEWAKSEGVTRLELTVVVDNDNAIKLYEKVGFELEGRKNNSLLIDGEYVDEYHMGKLLADK